MEQLDQPEVELVATRPRPATRSKALRDRAPSMIMLEDGIDCAHVLVPGRAASVRRL